MKFRNQIATILTASTMLVLGCTTENKESTTAPTEANTPKLPVDAVKVKLEPLNQEEALAGSILPSREVIITGELSKKITQILFKDGTYVNQGQTLYRLDDADIAAKHNQLKSEIQLAKLNESRLSELLKSQSVKQEEYDVAYTKLQSLLASEDLILSELQKTTITAPFSGFIGITKVQIGALVNPGMELVRLQEQSKIKVQFSVPESFVQSIRSGKEITFSVSGLDQRLTATIQATEPGLDYQNRSILVQALADNHDGLIKPGMSAKVYLKTSENHDGIVLPTEALMPGENGYNVFAVKGGLARITPVTIAERNENRAVITSGLTHGDTIMVSNMLRAGEGVPVELVTLN